MHGSVAVIKIVLQVDDDWNIIFSTIVKQTLRFETESSEKANNFFSFLLRSLTMCFECSIAACRRWKLFALLLIFANANEFNPHWKNHFSTLKEPKNKINKSIYSNIFSLSLWVCNIAHKNKRLSIFLDYFFALWSSFPILFALSLCIKCIKEPIVKRIKKHIGWISWLCLVFKISIWVFRLSFGGCLCLSFAIGLAVKLDCLLSSFRSSHTLSTAQKKGKKRINRREKTLHSICYFVSVSRYFHSIII